MGPLLIGPTRKSHGTPDGQSSPAIGVLLRGSASVSRRVCVRAVHHHATLLRLAVAVCSKCNMPTRLWFARNPKQRACHFASGLARSGELL